MKTYKITFYDTIKSELYDDLGNAVLSYINAEYKKHNQFGADISQKDMIKIFDRITESMVLKRLCEQAVRNYVSEGETIAEQPVTPIKRRK